MPTLSLSELSRHYPEGGGRRTVLDQIDFELDAGEFVALLGQSGSGKSTLLNLISGIDVPDSGRITLGDRVISALDEPNRTRWRRRELGFVFQFFNLIPTLTAFENVRLPLALNRLETPQRLAEARHLIDEVGLGDRADSFPEQLSGGEQQRLAVVRALVHQPALLLADEPTGNLDSATGSEVMALLLRLVRARGTSVLLVTHSGAVARLADRAVRLRDGRLEAAELPA